MEFLAPVPTVWMTPKFSMAASLNTFWWQEKRQRLVCGRDEDWTARELEVNFSFLPEGNFAMEAYQDGVNADRMAVIIRK